MNQNELMNQTSLVLKWSLSVSCELNALNSFNFTSDFSVRAFYFLVFWLAPQCSIYIYVLTEKLDLGLYLGYLYSLAHSYCFLILYQKRQQKLGQFTSSVRSDLWKFWSILLAVQLSTSCQFLAGHSCCLLLF